MKTYEELERLADAYMELALESKEDRRKFFQLIGKLTKEELLCLADIHERRAAAAFSDSDG